MHFNSELKDESQIIMFPLFETHSKYNKNCYSNGKCDKAFMYCVYIITRWSDLPNNKSRLLKDKRFSVDILPSYVLVL